MTGPTTEAASISLELKDDAKQERVSRIASRGWCSAPLSFCVPPIQHIEPLFSAIWLHAALLAGSRASLLLAYTPQHILNIPLADASGSELLELRTPHPSLRHITWKSVKYLEICEIQNPPRGLKPGRD